MNSVFVGLDQTLILFAVYMYYLTVSQLNKISILLSDVFHSKIINSRLFIIFGFTVACTSFEYYIFYVLRILDETVKQSTSYNETLSQLKVFTSIFTSLTICIGLFVYLHNYKYINNIQLVNKQ